MTRWPAQTADAIVALDGDRPWRIRKAVELAAAGVAPTVVVLDGVSSAPELFTNVALPFEVVSIQAELPSTRGEARAVARLARERGWKRIVVVTSTYHVPRARMIFARAFDDNVRFVGAGMRRRRLPVYLVSEAAKTLLALTLRRSP